MAKIFVEAYGCSASFADSEMISGLIQNGGHTLTDNSSESDLHRSYMFSQRFNCKQDDV
jgi:threonylcarbamoyladenosine tRNA methylthiotransferase CDKAL1